MTVRRSAAKRHQGSVLIIVLWVATGLVALALYFANTMSLEIRAADNRVSALAADQAIEAGARYVTQVLTTFATNGVVPDPTYYQCEAVPVGDACFWLIGRAVTYQVEPDQVFFGLVDEGAKLNVNTVTLETLELLTNMTPQLAANIYDWRNTNGTISDTGDGPTIYAQFNPSYMCKNAPYESVDELKYVYPVDTGILYGEDYNLNGALEPGEADTNRNSIVDSGLLEFLTVHTREPNTSPDGSQRINVSNLSSAAEPLRSMFETNLTAARATEVLNNLGISGTTGAPGGGQSTGGGGAGGGATGGGGRPPGGTGGGTQPGGSQQPGGGAAPAAQASASQTFTSVLAFYRASGLTEDEFAVINDFLTVTNGSFVYGRVNVNTAPLPVLACLPGMSAASAQLLVSFRQQAPDRLTSIAWVAEALAQDEAALQALSTVDCITSRSYQFTADIAALGPHGRGYRRVRFVYDLAEGSPKIVYRQDLSHLGWALGRYVRYSHGPLRGIDPATGRQARI